MLTNELNCHEDSFPKQAALRHLRRRAACFIKIGLTGLALVYRPLRFRSAMTHFGWLPDTWNIPENKGFQKRRFLDESREMSKTGYTFLNCTRF